MTKPVGDMTQDRLIAALTEAAIAFVLTDISRLDIKPLGY
jgi:hypothetical protein